MRSSPRTGFEASDHLPLEGELVRRLAQGALRQVGHVRGVDEDRMRSSENRAACLDALVIGESEYGGAFVGGSPSCGDPAKFLVREHCADFVDPQREYDPLLSTFWDG